jgi:hypothetical protein
MTSTAQEKGSEILISPSVPPLLRYMPVLQPHMCPWQLKYFSYILTLLHVMKAFGNWRLNLQLYISQHSYNLNCVIQIHNLSHLHEEYKRNQDILNMHDY